MPVRPNVLVGVTLWRVFVAWVAWYGFDQITQVSQYLPWYGLPPWYPVGAFGELSQLASLLTAVSYLGLAGYPLFVGGRRHEPNRAWLRGALAVLLWLVSLTAILVFDNHGQLNVPGFLFEHLITPLVVTVDLVAVGRSQRNLRWWYPLTWVAPPAAYFGYLAATGFTNYPGLFDPSDPARLSLVAAAFLGLIVVVGYLLLGLTRLTGLLARRPPLPVEAVATS
jgi:hypothetical protein